ncbi:hypothetical protein TMEN_4469 [Trichophyton mentagrophytes]|nr:hypothetical protein TMEN_4469 [Trichophyton mentagrophytes]
MAFVNYTQSCPEPKTFRAHAAHFPSARPPTAHPLPRIPAPSVPRSSPPGCIPGLPTSASLPPFPAKPSYLPPPSEAHSLPARPPSPQTQACEDGEVGCEAHVEKLVAQPNEFDKAFEEGGISGEPSESGIHLDPAKDKSSEPRDVEISDHKDRPSESPSVEGVQGQRWLEEGDGCSTLNPSPHEASVADGEPHPIPELGEQPGPPQSEQSLEGMRGPAAPPSDGGKSAAFSASLQDLGCTPAVDTEAAEAPAETRRESPAGTRGPSSAPSVKAVHQSKPDLCATKQHQLPSAKSGRRSGLRHTRLVPAVVVPAARSYQPKRRSASVAGITSGESCESDISDTSDLSDFSDSSDYTTSSDGWIDAPPPPKRRRSSPLSSITTSTPSARTGPGSRAARSTAGRGRPRRGSSGLRSPTSDQHLPIPSPACRNSTFVTPGGAIATSAQSLSPEVTVALMSAFTETLRQFFGLPSVDDGLRTDYRRISAAVQFGGARREKPSGMRLQKAPWTDKEDEDLARMKSRSWPWSEIQRQFPRRTPSALQQRWQILRTKQASPE